MHRCILKVVYIIRRNDERNSVTVALNRIEPGHSISYKIACALTEDLDQSVQVCRLIRVFAVRLKTLWLLGSHSVPCEYSDQTTRIHRLIGVFAGRTCNLAGNAVPRLILCPGFIPVRICILHKSPFYMTCPYSLSQSIISFMTLI